MPVIYAFCWLPILQCSYVVLIDFLQQSLPRCYFWGWNDVMFVQNLSRKISWCLCIKWRVSNDLWFIVLWKSKTMHIVAYWTHVLVVTLIIFWLIRFFDYPFISSLLIYSVKSWTLVCFIEHDHTHLLNILAKKKNTAHEDGCIWVWTLQHHKKNWPKLSKEETCISLLTNFEKWFLSCMDKHRKIHLQSSQTEIRSKSICKIETPFLEPLQTEEQKNGKC